MEAIRRSGLTIYDDVLASNPNLWIPTDVLQCLLRRKLIGFSVSGLAPRSRSKVVKGQICWVLGYPVPDTFTKTRPRFPGQRFDCYVQASTNLQVWNELVDVERRYVVPRVSDGVISDVRVISGEQLLKLDKTGTLTSKMQAQCIPGQSPTELVCGEDTAELSQYIQSAEHVSDMSDPNALPAAKRLLSLPFVFERLSGLVGSSFPDPGAAQERLRGAALHQLVCQCLGYTRYADDGQFPDITNQLLEIKLQTSPTIDLGLVEPNSKESLPLPAHGSVQARYCDVRYAVFYATTDGEAVRLTHLIMATGEGFFSRFPQFGGLKVNKKIQIPLPKDFF